MRFADLFCGGGGFSLGVTEAARRLRLGYEVVLAVENDDALADVYERNFSANLLRRDVCGLLDGDLGERPTRKERRLARDVGAVDLLVAGPPCQGNSDLNNHTRRHDPRNALYLRAIRGAEILRPAFLVVENVPAVQHDAGRALTTAKRALEEAGYSVAMSVLDLLQFGVPQRRRRHLLVAALNNNIEPLMALRSSSPCAKHGPRTVEWAIKDLLGTVASRGMNSPSVAKEVNRTRMKWLVDNDVYDLPNQHRPACHQADHTYRSMYGRLRWDAPAQTITTGYGSMGQGRYVHPCEPRTLTPHEAARLQTLPDFFDLDETKGRGVWASVIGNAVPPLLAMHLVQPMLRALTGEADNSQPRAAGE